MSDQASQTDLLELTAEIVSAHASNNTISTEELSQLIRDVHTTLRDLCGSATEAQQLTPVVPIDKSVTKDYIVCLEDGKKLKMLKRHLNTAYNMSPEEYRAKWGLPVDYPMVAPSYAKRRSSLAKKIGLGRKPAAKRKGK